MIQDANKKKRLHNDCGPTLDSWSDYRQPTDVVKRFSVQTFTLLQQLCNQKVTLEAQRRSLSNITCRTEVPRDVRNSKVRKQDKFRRDWSQH